MEFKSHRIDVLLEQALLEDQAPHDATTHITIDANFLAAGSIIAREELVVAGLGAIPRFFEIYARLDQSPEAQTRFEVVSHPEIFDGVRVHPGQVLAVIRHNARVLLSCERSQSAPAHERHRHPDAPIRRRDSGHARPHP
jgi:nicotinate-nucleotide pyrophosphorylase (carboxylating)